MTTFKRNLKIWQLTAKPSHPAWEPWYDKAFGFVVVAATEAEARQLANTEAGDENRYVNRVYLDTPIAVWLDDTATDCVEVTTDTPRIVLRDFASA